MKRLNLGRLVNPLIEEDELSQFTNGTGGGGGGGGDNPTPTPTPTPVVTAGGCSIIENDCPAGYVCQIVESFSGGLGFYAVPTYTAKCVQIPVATPTPTPTGNTCPQQGTFIRCTDANGLGLFAGGESPPGQPCNTFTAAADQCKSEVTCPPVGTFIRCTELVTAIGTIAEFSNGLQYGQCSSYTAVSDICNPKTCIEGFTGPTECNGSNVVQTYRKTDCSEELRTVETCAEKCVGGKCETTVTCTAEFVGEPRCLGNNIVRTFRNTDCSTENRIIDTCTQGCENAQCKCTPKGTFLGCTEVGGVREDGTGIPKNAGKYADGNCGIEYIANDPACYICEPTEEQFKGCKGTAGVYSDGCNERIQLNDLNCVIVDIIECEAGYQCEGTTAVVYTGTKTQDGKSCVVNRVLNDQRCIKIPECTCERFEHGAVGTSHQSACDSSTVVQFNKDCNGILHAHNGDLNGTPTCTQPHTGYFSVNGISFYYANGILQNSQKCEVIQPPPDGKCPLDGTFIECTGRDAVYYTGQGTPETTCRTTTVINDGRCVGDPPPPTPTPIPVDTSPLTPIVPTAGVPVPAPITPAAPTAGVPVSAPLTPTVPTVGVPVPAPLTPTVPTAGVPVSAPPAPPIEPARDVPPPPVLWRNCVDGSSKPQPIPANYKSSKYSGGGVCWEPVTLVSFEPDLRTALNFVYQRGSDQYPIAVSIKAVNPSYATTFEISFETNSEVFINPPKFVVDARNSTTFTLNVTPPLYDKLGDGDSVVKLNVNITEI